MPCQNGATCTGNVTQFKCECPAGFTGSLCQHSHHDCKSSPCVSGICVDEEDGYKCFCQPGKWLVLLSNKMYFIDKPHVERDGRHAFNIFYKWFTLYVFRDFDIIRNERWLMRQYRLKHLFIDTI